MIDDILLRTQVAALFKEGWSPEDIADELDIDVNDVKEYCVKLI